MTEQPPLFLMPDEQREAVKVFWYPPKNKSPGYYEARIGEGFYIGQSWPSDDTDGARRAAKGKAISQALKSLEREL